MDKTKITTQDGKISLRKVTYMSLATIGLVGTALALALTPQGSPNGLNHVTPLRDIRDYLIADIKTELNPIRPKTWGNNEYNGPSYTWPKAQEEANKAGSLLPEMRIEDRIIRYSENKEGYLKRLSEAVKNDELDTKDHNRLSNLEEVGLRDPKEEIREMAFDLYELCQDKGYLPR